MKDEILTESLRAAVTDLLKNTLSVAMTLITTVLAIVLLKSILNEVGSHESFQLRVLKIAEALLLILNGLFLAYKVSRSVWTIISAISRKDSRGEIK